MKKILTAIAATTAFIATPAIAGPTSSESFDITANVLDECSMADLSDVDFGTLAIDTGSGEGALLLTQSRIDSGQQAWTSCNYAADITIAGDPMQNQDQTNNGLDSGDFTDILHYRITMRSLTGEFLQANLRTTNGSSVTRTQSGAFHSNAQINTAFAPEDNPSRPLSGDYVATATVTLGAL